MAMFAVTPGDYDGLPLYPIVGPIPLELS